MVVKILYRFKNILGPYLLDSMDVELEDIESGCASWSDISASTQVLTR